MAEVFTISGAFGAAKTATGGPKGSIADLQRALNLLSQTVGDPTVATGVDNKLGPNTVTALNTAFSKYGGSRKTDWTVDDVRSSTPTVTSFVLSVVRQHGGSVPKPKAKKAGGASAADIIAAQQAAQHYTSAEFLDTHPNLVWWGLGGAGLIIALGFMAQRKRRAAQQTRVPAPA